LRPIVWGFILTIVGCFFWIIFSVIYGFAAAFSGEASPVGMALIYLFGFLFFFSIPITIVIEIVRWRRGKKKSQIPETRS